MTACKVSIIVPVYNTSKYLSRCIDSLLSQTLKEIEIIVVNDGSTDDSLQILRKYQALNPNKIYVYNTENEGVSHARNYGVTKSSGQYLWFVDSDDCVEPNACEVLFEKANKDNNDLVLFSRYDVNGETGEKIGNRTFHYNQNFTIREKPYELLKLSPFPWNKFIKKELFDGIEFPEKIRFEDLPISFILATKAKSIGVVNDFFYNYTVQVGFLSKFTESTLDIAKAIDFLINNLKESEVFDTYKNEIEYICVRHFLYRFEQLLSINGEENYELKLKLVNTLFDYLEENFPNFKSNKYIKYNLPDRLNKIFSFYSSRQALIDFVNRTKEMSEEEQSAYVETFIKENEVPKAFEFKTFDKIKEESNEASKKYNKLRKESPLKNQIIYITAQNHALPSSMLSLIKYAKTEKSDFEQIIAVRSGNEIDTGERLKRYNLGDIVVTQIGSDDYFEALTSAKYIFSDCALEYFFAKKDGQKYINLQIDNISANVSKKRDGECFEFATVQKSIITADASVYISEKSRESFEKAYKCNALPTRAIICDSPALDLAGGTSFASNGDKIKILFAPQFKAAGGRLAIIAFRKFMANLNVIDSELSDRYDIFVCLDSFPYDADFSSFNHIKKMPKEYDLYDFAASADCIITDYHCLMNVFNKTDKKIVRFILDNKRYITDEELEISEERYPVFTTPNELCKEIRKLEKSNFQLSKYENASFLFNQIDREDYNINQVENTVCLYCIGGKLTEKKIKNFRKLRKEQIFKTYYFAFDEELNPDYKVELKQLLKGIRIIPMRFDSYNVIDEKITNSIASKGRLPLGSSKKFGIQCDDEKRKYFGNIRFDEEIILSTGALVRNLMFIGLAKNLSYNFNWFSEEKYKTKKRFKAKVDYLCKLLENADEVKIKDDMKELKCVKNLKIAK